MFLAVARAGSSRAGAGALGVNQSTVSRRIGQLEAPARVRLFDRRPSGLVLTEAGEELFELAEDVEVSVGTVDRRLAGRDLELSGAVRLSLPDFLVGEVARHLTAFSSDYPKITVEVIADNGLVDLSRRDADIALRLSDGPPQQLVGRRIAPVKFAVYGAPSLLDPDSTELSSLNWIRWGERWRDGQPEQWIDARIPVERTKARINSSVAHAELVAAGMGVGIMPCLSGDADPRLVRVGDLLDFDLSLWVLVHEDLRKTARVRSLMRFLGDALATDRERFVGNAPG